MESSIHSELPCMSCGYNLQGLAVSARCPECGLDVESSVTKDGLAATDTRWLEKLRTASCWLRTGCLVAAWSFVVLLFGLALSGAADFVLKLVLGHSVLTTGPMSLVLGVHATYWFACLIGGLHGPLVAAWLIARPEPNEPDDAASLLRMVIRPCAALTSTLMVMWIALGYFDLGDATVSALPFAFVAWFLVAALAMRRLGRVCARSPRALNRRATTAWAKLVFVLLAAFGVFKGAEPIYTLLTSASPRTAAAPGIETLLLVMNDSGALLIGFGLVFTGLTLPKAARTAHKILSDELSRRADRSRTIRPEHLEPAAGPGRESDTPPPPVRTTP